MKRFAILLALSTVLLGPVAAYALSISIDSSATGVVDFSTTTSATSVQIANTYGGFAITNFGTGGARVESIDGSTDRLNLTGLSIRNNNSTTQTITINYSDLFNSAGSGFAGQQLAGAFSQASATNTITSSGFTRFSCSGELCPSSNPIDATTVFDGRLTATNRLSFGPLRETEGVNPCGGAGTDCYLLIGSTVVTLLPGRFVNLAGSHDIMVIEGAINDAGIIADFDAHLEEFHSQEVPEPTSLFLLLTGLGPLGYLVSRKTKR